MVFDKMHMKGHVDEWCKQNCDARSIEELREVCKALLLLRDSFLVEFGIWPPNQSINQSIVYF